MGAERMGLDVDGVRDTAQIMDGFEEEGCGFFGVDDGGGETGPGEADDQTVAGGAAEAGLPHLGGDFPVGCHDFGQFVDEAVNADAEVLAGGLAEVFGFCDGLQGIGRGWVGEVTVGGLRGGPAQGVMGGVMGLLYTIYWGAYTEGMPKEIATTQFRYRTAPEVVADALRDAIHRNEYAPGEQLHQEEIARKFGISRIPVRDALRQLQGEGLVDLYPNRGAFVSNPSPEELREVFQLRTILETHALRLAVAQYTAEDLARCGELLEQLERTKERAEWSRGDHAFHTALYAPCGQTRTLGLIEHLRGSVNRFYFLHFSPDKNGAANDREHRQLLAACERRDADEAVGLLEAHLMRALREVEEVQAGREPRR